MVRDDRSMSRVLIAGMLAVVVSAARGVATASTSPALTCVKQAQVDLKTCRDLVHQAGDQCTTTYLTAIPPCFGANAPCAIQCITTRMNCETGPKTRQTACVAACNHKVKGSQAACKGKPAQAAEDCSLRAKLAILKCTQKCARTFTIPLQRCGLDFSSCLKSCASPSGP